MKHEPVKCGCGGEAEIHAMGHEMNDVQYYVNCEKCDTRTWFFGSEEEAIDVWNNAMGAYREFEWCNECKEYDQKQHCCHRWTQNIRRTVEDLKAQYERPAKVENVREEYSSEGICFLTYADCGNCGMQVMLGDKFCSECGAKLDWGKDDDTN